MTIDSLTIDNDRSRSVDLRIPKSFNPSQTLVTKNIHARNFRIAFSTVLLNKRKNYSNPWEKLDGSPRQLILNPCSIAIQISMIASNRKGDRYFPHIKSLAIDVVIDHLNISLTYQILQIIHATASKLKYKYTDLRLKEIRARVFSEGNPHSSKSQKLWKFACKSVLYLLEVRKQKTSSKVLFKRAIRDFLAKRKYQKCFKSLLLVELFGLDKLDKSIESVLIADVESNLLYYQTLMNEVESRFSIGELVSLRVKVYADLIRDGYIKASILPQPVTLQSICNSISTKLVNFPFYNGGNLSNSYISDRWSLFQSEVTLNLNFSSFSMNVTDLIDRDSDTSKGKGSRKNESSFSGLDKQSHRSKKAMEISIVKVFVSQLFVSLKRFDQNSQLFSLYIKSVQAYGNSKDLLISLGDTANQSNQSFDSVEKFEKHQQSLALSFQLSLNQLDNDDSESSSPSNDSKFKHIKSFCTANIHGDRVFQFYYPSNKHVICTVKIGNVLLTWQQDCFLLMYTKLRSFSRHNPPPIDSNRLLVERLAQLSINNASEFFEESVKLSLEVIAQRIQITFPVKGPGNEIVMTMDKCILFSGDFLRSYFNQQAARTFDSDQEQIDSFYLQSIVSSINNPVVRPILFVLDEISMAYQRNGEYSSRLLLDPWRINGTVGISSIWSDPNYCENQIFIDCSSFKLRLNIEVSVLSSFMYHPLLCL